MCQWFRCPMWCANCDAVVVYIDKKCFQMCETKRQNTGPCPEIIHVELFGRGLRDPLTVCNAPACLEWRASKTRLRSARLQPGIERNVLRERADRAAHEAAAPEREERRLNEEARVRHERLEHDHRLREEMQEELEHRVRRALRANERRVRAERRADEARWLRHASRRRPHERERR